MTALFVYHYLPVRVNFHGSMLFRVIRKLRGDMYHQLYLNQVDVAVVTKDCIIPLSRTLLGFVDDGWYFLNLDMKFKSRWNFAIFDNTAPGSFKLHTGP